MISNNLIKESRIQDFRDP